MCMVKWCRKGVACIHDGIELCEEHHHQFCYSLLFTQKDGVKQFLEHHAQGLEIPMNPE